MKIEVDCKYLMNDLCTNKCNKDLTGKRKARTLLQQDLFLDVVVCHLYTQSNVVTERTKA